MAERYNGFKKKIAIAMAQNPYITKADIDDLRKRYRNEYSRLMKLKSSAERKISMLATAGSLSEALEMSLRQSMLSPEGIVKAMGDTFEEFFSTADQIHTSQSLIDYIEESIKQEDEQNEDAFNYARSMAEEGLEAEYNPEPYNTRTSNAKFLIRDWWSRVSTPGYSDITKNLPVSILQQVANWKNATIKLIGDENFIDLMQNKMGYHVDAIDGDLDWDTFFGEVYIESEHRYETDSEAASRIGFWMQKASEEAMDYLSEDSDMGDYDEVSQNIIDELDDISMYTW